MGWLWVLAGLLALAALAGWARSCYWADECRQQRGSGDSWKKQCLDAEALWREAGLEADRLKTDLAGAQAARTDLGVALEACSEALRHADADREDWKVRARGLEVERATLAGRLAALEGEYDVLKSKTAREADELRQGVATLTAECDDLKGKLAVAEAARDAWHRDYEDAAHALDCAGTECERLRRLDRSWHAAVAGALRQLTGLPESACDAYAERVAPGDPRDGERGPELDRAFARYAEHVRLPKGWTWTFGSETP